MLIFFCLRIFCRYYLLYKLLGPNQNVFTSFNMFPPKAFYIIFLFILHTFGAMFTTSLHGDAIYHFRDKVVHTNKQLVTDSRRVVAVRFTMFTRSLVTTPVSAGRHFVCQSTSFRVLFLFYFFKPAVITSLYFLLRPNLQQLYYSNKLKHNFFSFQCHVRI